MYPMCGMSQYSAPEGSAQHQPPSEESTPGKPASSGVAAGTPGAATSTRDGGYGAGFLGTALLSSSGLV